MDRSMEEQAKQTHFISMPLALDDIDVQRSFLGFRETVLSDKSLEAVQNRQL